MEQDYLVFVLDSAVEAIARMSRTNRRRVREFVQQVALDPFDEGDFRESDESGRVIFCKLINDHAISYYPDHAVKEVKILEVVRADR